MNIPALRTWSGRLLVPALLLPTFACPLAAIEPDEIDIADEAGDDGSESEGEASEETGDDSLSSEGTGTDGNDTDASDTTDPTSGDGDGDGDTTDTSPPDTSDDSGSDADSGTTDGGSCESTGSVGLGETWVEIPDTPSTLESECGGELSGEAILEFVAPEPGTYRFSITGADVTAVLYLVDASCLPLGDCATEPALLEVVLEADTPSWVVVDSNSGSGSGTLVIEKI